MANHGERILEVFWDGPFDYEESWEADGRKSAAESTLVTNDG
ncbi:MAG: hypothetical protein ACI9WU_005224 [Myxococcota bacterium]|jgi:hypothetical protein